jgi:hypothetical protein
MAKAPRRNATCPVLSSTMARIIHLLTTRGCSSPPPTGWNRIGHTTCMRLDDCCEEPSTQRCYTGGVPAQSLYGAVLLDQDGLQLPHLVLPDGDVVLPLRYPVTHHVPHQNPAQADRGTVRGRSIAGQRVASCRVVSCRVVSFRVVSCRFVSCRVVRDRACGLQPGDALVRPIAELDLL